MSASLQCVFAGRTVIITIMVQAVSDLARPLTMQPPVWQGRRLVSQLFIDIFQCNLNFSIRESASATAKKQLRWGTG
jgi:hypothetical protein